MREIYFSLPLRILHHIKFISVHHGRTSICILPFKFSSVIGMDMAVEEKFRVVFIHQGKKCFKAPVRQILHIIQAEGRRMGYKDIKASVPEKLPSQLSDAARIWRSVYWLAEPGIYSIEPPSPRIRTPLYT